MRKFSIVAGSHVVGDKVFNAGDVVASDDDLVKLHRGKFVLLPEPEVVYVEVPSTTVAPEPVAEALVPGPVAEATEAVEAVEAPKAKKAK